MSPMASNAGKYHVVAVKNPTFSRNDHEFSLFMHIQRAVFTRSAKKPDKKNHGE